MSDQSISGQPRAHAAASSPTQPLAGVRGLLLDLDGVLFLRDAAIPGAQQALRRLDAAGIPWVVVTNTSLVSRQTLSTRMAALDLAIPTDRIMTAASGTAARVCREFPDRPLYVMAAPDALTEFAGLRLISHDEAAAPEAVVAAVVVGDAGDDFTPRNIQSAFRLLRRGARFVAMHKNRWWITPEGETLDAGAYVSALEFATERRALVMGKPSAAFFREGVKELSALAGITLSPRDVAMVGDDLWNDVRGAQKAGIRGVFVRSGKHGDAELTRIARETPPNAVFTTIVEVVDALLG